MVAAATISQPNRPSRHGCARLHPMAESYAAPIPRGCHGRAGRAFTSNAENACERFFWALQGVNFNVYGIVSASGDLVERYEYTPYGQRTVYSRGWLRADLNGDGVVDSTDGNIISGLDGTAAVAAADLNGDGVVSFADFLEVQGAVGDSVADDPLVMHSRLESFRTDSQDYNYAGGYGSLCDVGHQGLLHDKEFGPAATGLVHNRARTLNPPLARFNQRDPLGYPDGMNGYEYVGSRPMKYRDPSGLLGPGAGPNGNSMTAVEHEAVKYRSENEGASKEETTRHVYRKMGVRGELSGYPEIWELLPGAWYIEHQHTAA